jgi:hypothetical protein
MQLLLQVTNFLLASLRQDVFLKHRHGLELLHLHFVQCELHQLEKSAESASVSCRASLLAWQLAILPRAPPLPVPACSRAHMSSY